MEEEIQDTDIPGISLTVKVFQHPNAIYTTTLESSLPDGAPVPLEVLEAATTALIRQRDIQYMFTALNMYQATMQAELVARQQEQAKQSGLVVPVHMQKIPQGLR